MKIKKGVAWRRVMTKGSSLSYGPDYWSNGHFLIVGEPPSKALRDGNGNFELYERQTKSTINSLVGKGKRKEYFIADARRVPREEQISEFSKKDVVEIGGSWFDEDYVRVFCDMFKSFNFFVGESKEIPAVIKRDGEVIGLLMPIKQY